MEPWVTAVIVAGGAFAGSLVGHLLPFWHTSRTRKHQYQVEGYNAIVAAEALIEKADREILKLDRGQMIDLMVITRRILPFIGKKDRDAFEAKISEIRQKAGIAVDAAASLRTSELMPMSLTAGTVLGSGFPTFHGPGRPSEWSGFVIPLDFFKLDPEDNEEEAKQS